MRARLAVVMSVACAVVAAAMPASASEAPPRGLIADHLDFSGYDPEPWQPYREEDFTLPGGTYCPFTVDVHIVEDEELVRVDSRYPDGSVHIKEYKGKLVSDFTNTESGDTVRRDLSGHGWGELRPDGSTKIFGGFGPWSAGFKTTDAYPVGYYVLDGLHFLRYDSAGRRHMALAVGSEENLCRTLA